MHERDLIFRERLIALMTGLNTGGSSDPQLQRIVGLYALSMPKDAGARDWADIKRRADGPTYDSMLRLFQSQSEVAAKAGDTNTVRALEVLAISLIARWQQQESLVPGVALLDKFIAECASRARRAGAQFIPTQRARN